MFLGLEGILLGIGIPQDFQLIRNEFHRLALTRAGDKLTADPQGGRGGDSPEQIITEATQGGYHLQMGIRGTIVQRYKLVVPKGPYPTHYGYLLPFCGKLEQFPDPRSFLYHRCHLKESQR